MSRNLHVELHCHSHHSYDGHLQFEQLMELAKRRRLDAVAITDHDSIEGGLEFRRCVRKGRNTELFVILGEERTLSNGTHVIGLFLQHAIQASTLDMAIDEILSQGGVCVIPHPYRARTGVLAAGANQFPAGGVCFEVFNPTCSFDENRSARELASLGWTAVGGSDAHYQSQLGECVNEIQFHGSIEQSLREALLGISPIKVLGVRQGARAAGRSMIPSIYRRIQPHFDVPSQLKPSAGRMLRVLRDQFAKHKKLQLEMKWDPSQFVRV
ncbi:MAG TPA: PHP domain-containing protein [Candidatus Acidoferrales bacterium]|nr:PHP domain-containing protein [Candidatus Acidoferrales bacterium]